VRVEVLERDGRDVRSMELGEVGAPAEAEPVEIGVEVEHRGECTTTRTIAGRVHDPRAALPI
jgi:uncharacterized FAD-dependent dehydrogenase